MLRSIISRIIPDNKDISDPAVRRAVGTACCILGVIANVLLSAVKLAAGFLSGSIAVIADGLNNLSDAASSVIAVIGFRLSGKDSDAEHPFGHGRMEYISGLIVAMVILLMGFELAKTSVSRILNPQSVGFDSLTAAALIMSAVVKLGLFFFDRNVSRRIASPSLKAAAIDAAADACASLAVLAGGAVQHTTGMNIDGWTGLIVSALILRAGYCAARDTISPLLGNPPSPDLVQKVEEIVLECDMIHAIHDLIVHDYGPGRLLISLHAEVPADGELIAIHDAIDSAERRLKALLNCEAVIHMDPVFTHSEQEKRIRDRIARAIAENVDPRITIHDFRLCPGPAHTNVIFDAVIPFGHKATDTEIRSAIRRAVRETDPDLFATVTVEHAYSPDSNP